MDGARRRAIVAVFGGDVERARGRALGAALARAGVWILTGRRPESNGRVTGEVPSGALDAEVAGLGTARLIAIEPSEARAFTQTGPHRLLILSGLTHIARDAPNGLTPDAVIAMRGAEGTLCELAFASAAGKPIVFVDSAAHLRERFAHLRETGVREYLQAAQAGYPHFTVAQLDAALHRLLTAAVDAGGVDAALDRVLAQAAAVTTAPPAFPGIPDGDRTSIDWFAAHVD